ncbi:MAG: hypothetical protein FXF54_09605 [Kosmotoga sp.]|nr:MAG: hypothetical protein FXF54_09605 [Kosmotoga sp.]
MKKLLLVLLVVSIALIGFSKADLSTLTFYTIDLETGKSEIFPIVYLTIEPVNNIGLRIEDYLTLEHDTLSLGTMSLAIPRLYYLYYYGDRFEVMAGNFRSKHYNTRKINMLRVGGFYDYNLGVETSYNPGDFVFLGRYNYNTYENRNEFGAMFSYNPENLSSSLYFSKKGANYDLSIDGSYKLKLSSAKFDMFGSIAFYGESLFSAPGTYFSNPTFLAGTLFEWNKLSGGFQYAKQGSWNIDFDFGDPNKGSQWVVNTYLNYNLTPDLAIGAFFDWNSLRRNFGTKITYEDLELILSNGDCDGGLSGAQRIELNYSSYFTINLEKPFSGLLKKEPITEEKSYPSINEIKEKSNLGEDVTVKGIIATDAGRLDEDVTYVVDKTGGYMVWGNMTEGLKRGDEVIIKGYLKEYYGTTEIVVNNVEIISSNNEVPIINVTPLEVFSGKYESALVKIKGKVSSLEKYSFMLSSNGNEIKTYLKKGTNISLDKLSYGDELTVVGIVAQYQGEWEILPRDQQDIILSKN